MTVSSTNFRRILSVTIVATGFALAGAGSCEVIQIRDSNVRISAPSSRGAGRSSDDIFRNAANAALAHAPGDRGPVCADLARA